MAKKRDRQKKPAEPPAFQGFRPLAGLGELKAKLAEEEKRAADAQATSPARAPARRPARPAAPKRSSTTGEDDELSFHRMMQGVTPLGHGASRVPVTSEVRAVPRVSKAELEAKARSEAEAVLEHLHHLVDDAACFEVTDDGKRVEGRRADASPALVRSLRRGVLPIDATLDLHGLTAAEGKEALLAFLREKRARGERCVLVVHGKGERVEGSGVLRGEIAAWLSQGRAREHVAAFASAQGRDGGDGAVYVALRR